MRFRPRSARGAYQRLRRSPRPVGAASRAAPDCEAPLGSRGLPRIDFHGAETSATVSYWEGRLPHWEVEDGKYFVTLHLTGAIPEQGRVRIRALTEELERVPEGNRDARLRLRRHIFREMEAWLDRAGRVTHLRDERVAHMVMEAISFRIRNGVWQMFDYVVMPNHVHLFLELLGGDLKTVVEGFKRWTGHEAGKLLRLDGGRFWQREWFDHWSRSDEESEKIVAYIRANPVKAGLVKQSAEWPYASWTCEPR